MSFIFECGSFATMDISPYQNITLVWAAVVVPHSFEILGQLNDMEVS